MTSEPQHRAATEFTFRSRGFGRYLSAMFLALWLCGWAVAEAFAVLLLGQGIWSLLTGSPLIGSGEPGRMAPAVAVGAFLLIWLTIWTFGGLMAIRELLRSLWAEDRLVLEPDALMRIRRLGPFASIRRLVRGEILSVFVQPANTALMAQLNAKVIELTDLGTPAERREAAQRLRAAMDLQNKDMGVVPPALPTEWQEVTGSHGERLLVPNLQARRQQSRAVAIIAGVVWTGLLLLAWEALRDPRLWAVTLMLAALAAWLARQTLWMLRGRKEWRLEHGRLVHQRRLGNNVAELCEARALELTESRDSDGDRWYHLNAVDLARPLFTNAGKIPRQIKIMHSISDPTAPRGLGQWLSDQSAIPFHDRVPNEADKQAEISRMLKQLTDSGEFGRFVARVLARLVERTAPRERGE